LVIRDSSVLPAGATYKEDVPDTRESAAIKLLDRLAEAGADVAFHDPLLVDLTDTAKPRLWPGAEVVKL